MGGCVWFGLVELDWNRFGCSHHGQVTAAVSEVTGIFALVMFVDVVVLLFNIDVGTGWRRGGGI